jgi:hypothetical protein
MFKRSWNEVKKISQLNTQTQTTHIFKTTRIFSSFAFFAYLLLSQKLLLNSLHNIKYIHTHIHTPDFAHTFILLVILSRVLSIEEVKWVKKNSLVLKQVSSLLDSLKFLLKTYTFFSARIDYSISQRCEGCVWVEKMPNVTRFSILFFFLHLTLIFLHEKKNNNKKRKKY